LGKIFEALEKADRKEKRLSSLDNNKKFQEIKLKNKVKERIVKKKDKTIKKKVLHKKNRSRKSCLITVNEPDSFFAEQFKILRTNLLFPISGNPPKIIMVTSVMPNEGKSFVASNLAVSIAQDINKHVLLVDCDLRKPTISNNFNIMPSLGLSDYLEGNVFLNRLLVKTDIEKLTILPSGKQTHKSSELLSSEKMQNLLKEITDRYEDRYIIIDSPPPQIASESMVVSRHVDGVLLVVAYRSKKVKDLKNIIKNMGSEKILGVVFNKLELNLSTKFGYSKYGDYYKQYTN
jgi:exopolysaccharide/PEP-CTERM locus tyrosine autokinase